MILPNVPNLHAFLLIYRERNMTRAAEELRLSKAALTKRLHQLEGELGYPVFRRSTRSLTPTPEGERLYRSSSRLFDSIRDFDAEARGEGAMAGSVRVAATSAMARKFLSRLLVRFQSLHPEVRVGFVATGGQPDLVDGHVDLALWVGGAPAAGLHGRKLGQSRAVVCAAPAYLKGKAVPRRPMDLRQHPVAYVDAHERLRFSKSGLTLKEAAGDRGVTSNDAHFVTEMGLLGQALVVRPAWDVRDELRRGRLVPVLESDPIEPDGDVWLLASAEKLQTRRSRALFDFLAKELVEHL